MKKKLLLFTLLCAVSLPLHAQKKQLLSGESLLKEAAELRQQKDYKGAIDLYNQAHDGDAHYWDILIERATAHYLDSNYTQAIKEADYLENQTGQIKRSGLMIKGAAYSTNQEFANAHEVFDKLIAINEHDFNPYYEKGIVAFNEKNYEKAMQYFHTTLLMNPYYFRAHYNLGVVYSKLGRLTESILALQTALIFTHNPEFASAAFRAIEEVAAMSEEITKNYNNSNQNNNPFEATDAIIASKIVNSRDYNSGLLIDEIATRQMQVAIANTALDLKEDNFVMQYYMPLLKELANQDINALQMFMFSDFEIQSIKKYVSKKSNINTIKAIKLKIDKYCDDIIGTRILNFEKRQEAPNKYLYLPDDLILVMGDASYDYTTKDIVFGEGKMSIFYNGVLLSEGDYKNGKKEGVWKYYNKTTGKTTKVEHYNTGLITKLLQYYSNDVLSFEEDYDQKEVVKQSKKYAFGGNLTSEIKYENTDKYYGKYYTSYGVLTRDVNINKEKVTDAKDTVFYSTGKPLRILAFENGEIDGWLYEYYESGKLKEKRFYNKGLINDIETTYWENGNLYSEIAYLNDQQHGLVKYYDKDGKLIKTDHFQNGKAHGLEVSYDAATGNKKYEKLFKNNHLHAYTYYNTKGEIIYEEKDNGKPVSKYLSYDMYGNKLSELSADEKGTPIGVTYSYFPSGIIKTIDTLQNGETHGISIVNFSNGERSEEINFNNGLKSGLYNKYYENGTLYYSGNYSNDTIIGVWEYFNHDGTKFRQCFFQDGIINGSDIYYHPNGKMRERILYSYGNIQGLVKYDTSGVMIDSFYYKNINGPVNLNYANGNKYIAATLKNGKYEGSRKVFYPNQQLMTEQHYLYGNKHGKETYYTPTGAAKYFVEYNNGSMEGKAYYLNALGDTTDLYNYENNAINGITTKFFNKQKRYEIEYKNDDINGKYTYYANDKIAVILYYDNGLLIGYAYYDKDNQLIPMIPISKGTGDILAYFPNGQKSFEAKRVKNQYEGKVIMYFENGKIAEERNFLNGNFEGESKYYNNKGTLVAISNYKNDELHGSREQFDDNGKLIQKEMFFMGDLNGEAIYNEKKYTYYFGQVMK